MLCGGLLYTSSVQGLLAVPHRSAYSASKHALHGFVHSLQYEQPALRISLHCPGYVATQLSLHALSHDGSAYNRMDESTRTGMDAGRVAERMVAGWWRGEDEVWLCDAQTRVGVWMQWVAPGLLKGIMRKRGTKNERRMRHTTGKCSKVRAERRRVGSHALSHTM